MQRFKEKLIASENPSRGDYQLNGSVEKAMQDAEEAARTTRSCLETDMKAKLPLDHLVKAWTIDAAADCMNRLRGPTWIHAVGKNRIPAPAKASGRLW